MDTLIKKVKHLHQILNDNNVQKILYYLTDLTNNPRYRNLLDTALISKGLTYAPSELVLLKNKLQNQKTAHDNEAAKHTIRIINNIKHSHQCYVYFDDYSRPVSTDDVAQAIQILLKKINNIGES